MITVKLFKKARRLFRRGVLRKVKITAAVGQTGAATQRSQRTYSLKAAPRKKRR